MKFDKFEIILCVFVAAVIVLSAINFSIIYGATQKVTETHKLVEESKIPAKIELVKILDSSCDKCFDINSVVKSLKDSNVNVTSEKELDFSSTEAQNIVKKYNILKIPTVIVIGQINKTSSISDTNWVRDTKNNFAYYSSVGVPFVDVSTGEVKGLVSYTNIVDSSCNNCSNLSQVVSYLKENGVKFSEEQNVEYNTVAGQTFIDRFGIKEVPAIVISSEVLEYPDIKDIWDKLNATEKDGYYALHPLSPPYRDLSTNKIVGLTTVVYLKDSSCSSCYDVFLNKEILELSLGIFVENETTVDLNSTLGKDLISKYNITKVPIIIISPDASVYKSFTSIWPQVGDTSNDGWYVMRNPGLLGTYRDLKENKTITQVTVYAGDDQYQPKNITVNFGDTLSIRFVNAGQLPHTFAIDELGVRSGVVSPKGSETIFVTANQTGNFRYYSYYKDDRRNGLEGVLTIG
ncbi:MAG: cupredoxin domain-containing protein [Candidatus Aenigmarchaeota archaeon]|nr:cupredoxin domain-containing protein [Candidatus Aenigmarchaeota archaeon]